MTTIVLGGRLAARGDEPLGDHCPLGRAIGLFGNRVSLLLVREVAYGTHRFDALAKRAGITEAVAATRLKELVAAGVLTKVPYREPGQRERHEYVLTDAGRELVPILMALVAWGERHTPGGGPAVAHDGCGADVAVALTCAAGHDLDDEALRVTG
ncbi:helix-turn-helix domain-containing protein [Nocardioides sp. YIM 152588]|uniref:winged helix-turn-helix transcriptional regulator n=1 Tax=Nocardioides sp. YIM 152588 TaxID=3158259 RepID=UPI0032E4E064